MRQRLRRKTLLIAAFTLGFGGCAIAGPMEDGQAAYDRGDYMAAQELWRPLAEQGIARAQNNLGVMYENAKGVPQDVNEALKWYRLAAEQGYAGAQNNLGLIYALGRGAPRDPVRAYMWFSLAASSLSGDLAASNSSSPPQVSTPAMATTSHEVTRGDYPQDSIRLHESGAVTVTYVINEMGSVTSCSVVLSSGNGRLDNAACAIVKRRWKYTPATQDGKPASIQYISKIVFPRR